MAPYRAPWHNAWRTHLQTRHTTSLALLIALLASPVGRAATAAFQDSPQEPASNGGDGMNQPMDLPPEEAAELEVPARAAGLHLVYLLAPTSTLDRIALVAAHASGFIYCVSVAGVTGSRTALSDEVPAFLARVRQETDLPLAIGFGISTPEQVEVMGRVADAVVVGSAFVQAVEAAPLERRAETVRAFVEGLAGRDGRAAATAD